jgi:hypothetical protein
VRRAINLGLLLALVAAVPALAATTVYRGQTNQDRGARLEVNDGVLDLIAIRWVADCRRPGKVFRGLTRYANRPEGPIERDGDAFSDSGTTRGAYRRIRWIQELAVSGTFLPESRARGVHTVRVRVYRRPRGSTRYRRVDTCRARVTFRARAG